MIIKKTMLLALLLSVPVIFKVTTLNAMQARYHVLLQNQKEALISELALQKVRGQYNEIAILDLYCAYFLDEHKPDSITTNSDLIKKIYNFCIQYNLNQLTHINKLWLLKQLEAFISQHENQITNKVNEIGSNLSQRRTIKERKSTPQRRPNLEEASIKETHGQTKENNRPVLNIGRPKGLAF